MARVTNGLFTPVREPKNLGMLFEELDFADVEGLEIRNRTTGEAASYQIQNADGSFSALVPVREGRNVLEVVARSTDGAQARQEVAVRLLEGAAPTPLSPRLVAQRNRLLENRLADLRRRNLQIETERDEQIRQELKVEIERERAAARKRTEELKRSLDLEVEE
jgi:hypothetical protein